MIAFIYFANIQRVRLLRAKFNSIRLATFSSGQIWPKIAIFFTGNSRRGFCVCVHKNRAVSANFLVDAIIVIYLDLDRSINNI